jgi:hypothetical protein
VYKEMGSMIGSPRVPPVGLFVAVMTGTKIDLGNSIVDPSFRTIL